MMVKEFSKQFLKNISSQISKQIFRQTIVALFVAPRYTRMQVAHSKGIRVQDLKGHSCEVSI